MYSVGLVIKKEREKYEISQEELCDGICAVSTLSRIENNEQVATMEKAFALLSKLGLNGSNYLSLVSEEEYEIYQIKVKIESLFFAQKYAEAYELVKEHEKELNKNKFRKQFSLMVNAAKECYINKKYETAIDMTEEAIRYTCLQYDKDKKIRYLLTDAEINVINIMAVSYWESNSRLTAIKILTNLIEAMNDIPDCSDRRKKIFPLLLCNLSKWLCCENRISEADMVIEDGRLACIQSGKFRMLPFFICCKAEVMQKKECDIEAILKEYLSAYLFFNNMGYEEIAVGLRSQVIDEYHRDLDKIIIPEI